MVRMVLPERDWVPLGKAAEFVAQQGGAEIAQAREALIAAFDGFSLRPWGRRRPGDRLERISHDHWLNLAATGGIDWVANTMTWRSFDRTGLYLFVDVCLRRNDLARLIHDAGDFGLADVA